MVAKTSTPLCPDATARENFCPGAEPGLEERMRLCYAMLPTKNGPGRSPWSIDLPVLAARLSHGQPDTNGPSLLPEAPLTLPPGTVPLDMAATQHGEELAVLDASGRILVATASGQVRQTLDPGLTAPRGLFLDQEQQPCALSADAVFFRQRILHLPEKLPEGVPQGSILRAATCRDSLFLLLQSARGEKALVRLHSRRGSVRCEPVPFSFDGDIHLLFSTGEELVVSDRFGNIFFICPDREQIRPLDTPPLPAPVQRGCAGPAGLFFSSGNRISHIAPAPYGALPSVDLVTLPLPAPAGAAVPATLRTPDGFRLAVLDPGRANAPDAIQQFCFDSRPTWSAGSAPFTSYDTPS